MMDGMKAFKQGYKGKSKDLKGKESLSDYQKRTKDKKLAPTIEALRESILRM